MSDPSRDLWFMNGRVSIEVSKADSEDGVSVIMHEVPSGDGPPLHVHYAEDEIFFVVAGELTLKLGDDTLAAGPGRTLLIPRGVPHAYKVVSQGNARFLTLTRGGFEDLVRQSSRPAEGEGLPPVAEPTPEQQEALAKIAIANGVDMVGPPLD